MQRNTTSPEWLKWTTDFLGVQQIGGELIAQRTWDVEPMSQPVSDLFCRLMLDEMVGKSSTITAIMEDLRTVFTGQVLLTRLDSLKCDLSDAVKIMVTAISSSPGDAVMWSHALKRLSMIQGKPITLSILSETFPVGFPTQASLSRSWDAQKGVDGCDNMLDTVGCA